MSTLTNTVNQPTERVRSASRVRTITAIAMLTAVSVVIAYISKAMPPVMFLDFDFKHVAVCIGGFTFGPLAAAVIGILASFIEFITFSGTGPFGFLMNALSTCSFCCTASFIYKKNHTKKGAVIGLSAGLAVMVAVMLLWNYLITPLYMTVNGELVTREQVAAMLPTVFLPFNLAKGGMNMAATLLLYKPVVTALRKSGLIPPSQSNTEGKKFNLGFLLFSLALLATFAVFALVLAGVI